MEKILFINACLRGNSRTLELAKYVLKKVQGTLEEVKLYDINPTPLNLNTMEIRENAKNNNDYSNEIFTLGKQFAAADTIVIAAPYWDLMFPAILKNYFETITVSGLTFVYGENGRPKGLCKAKKLIYVTTSGGYIMQNFGFQYTEAIAKAFFGINEVQFVSAQGLDIYGADVAKIMDDAKKSF